MEQETRFGIYEGAVVPESALLGREVGNLYGSVEGLPDDELADPDELERQYLKEEFAPILALPQRASKGLIRPNVDEDGQIEWGAFGTVDFDRYRPKFDKMLYKADRLKEEVAHQCIMMEMISARIKTWVKYRVIKYVKMGILDLGDITDFDMYCLAERYLRTRSLQRQIVELEEKSWREQEKRRQKFWISL